MNAKEARQKSENTSTIVDKNQFNQIMLGIEHATKNGAFCFKYHDNISLKNKERLRELGYKINYFSDFRDNESHTIISW